MNASTFKSWLGQITTGIGALIAVPVVMALLTSQITLDQAIPGIVAAVIGLIWPENKQLAESAQTLASGAEVLIPQLLTAYRSGLQHGAQPVVPPAAPKLAQISVALPAAPPASAPTAPQAT
jgi:hypothetical protein